MQELTIRKVLFMYTDTSQNTCLCVQINDLATKTTCITCTGFELMQHNNTNTVSRRERKKIRFRNEKIKDCLVTKKLRKLAISQMSLSLRQSHVNSNIHVAALALIFMKLTLHREV